MAEEVEQSEGGSKSFKNILIGLVSTITLGVGGFITNKLTGGGDDKAPAPAAAPVINVTTNQTQQAGKTVIVNGGGSNSAKPATPAPAPKKKEGDEFKEKPAQW